MWVPCTDRWDGVHSRMGRYPVPHPVFPGVTCRGPDIPNPRARVTGTGSRRVRGQDGTGSLCRRGNRNAGLRGGASSLVGKIQRTGGNPHTRTPRVTPVPPPDPTGGPGCSSSSSGTADGGRDGEPRRVPPVVGVDGRQSGVVAGGVPFVGTRPVRASLRRRHDLSSGTAGTVTAEDTVYIGLTVGVGVGSIYILVGSDAGGPRYGVWKRLPPNPQRGPSVRRDFRRKLTSGVLGVAVVVSLSGSPSVLLWRVGGGTCLGHRSPLTLRSPGTSGVGRRVRIPQVTRTSLGSIKLLGALSSR